MTLTTMFLHHLTAKVHFSDGDQMGTIFSVLFWIVAFVVHHVC